jgi:DeoR/GlpR family transcriptional regulator of sugar metabolism
MIASQRRTVIKEMLLQQRSVKVADLVREFKVSEETIRRDLNTLEQEGIVQKNYGGAILNPELERTMVSIPPVYQRASQFSEEKEAIGKTAASWVSDQQIVILDAGSTTWYVAKHLRHLKQMTIVTNGINIVEECSHIEDASIILIGGKLIKKSMSLVGPQAESEFQKYNAHYAFLGTSGISFPKGFTSSDIFEAETKRAMVSAGQKVVVVADHSKLQKQALVSFASFQHVDILLTSDLADKQLLEQIASMGTEVVVTQVQTREFGTALHNGPGN